MLYNKHSLCFALLFVYIAVVFLPLYSAESKMSSNSTEEAAEHQKKNLFGDVSRSSPFSEQEYDRLILKMYVSSANIPLYWFEKGEWQLKEDNCWVSGSEDEVVSPYQFNMIKHVRYYRYKNMHPLDSAYYAQDEGTVNFLKRFCFYRFTGKTLLPWLDVYLFALDMHTGLLFYYALPSRFDKILGNSVPRDWVALEKHPYVKEKFPNKKFYEFDPIGIMQTNGKIFLYEWFTEQNKRKDSDIGVYIPHFDDYKDIASQASSGYSPYRIK
ncbi:MULTISPECIES: hypothetical protein [unclassified Treponema]|uniref:hypothetical protein n=1 Tax=unclassified Treponema TaxID=2638727 RepID=UPI0005301227|nr:MULTISPECIES: hypothetical protein [unclassified Treponema]AIW89061.1 hypothetical protein JO41_03920 [Treponema sp. OMZ 838]UTC44617.1 hypothetical protein E4N66_11355 [Treponema sp. OMZ 857]UTC50963.1 hypothetical protein E4N65_01045 [Treponema sp. OMZ 855]